MPDEAEQECIVFFLFVGCRELNHNKNCGKKLAVFVEKISLRIYREVVYNKHIRKDITMNVCIQIRDVLKLLQQHFHISFEEAALKFYKSETYKTLQETENGLWAESAEYIADRYYEEAENNQVTV